MGFKHISLRIRRNIICNAAVVLIVCNIFPARGLSCYDTLDLQTRPPLWQPTVNIFSVLAPQCPNVVGVTFTLYTRYNPFGEAISVINNNMNSIFFGANKETKVIIHGWRGNSAEDWVTGSKNAFLLKMDANVILVDWKMGASGEYFIAAPNTVIVGLETALLIQTIIKTLRSTSDKFHIIGFSLGAHAAGFAGERIPGLRRITGLDPAAPLFTPILQDVSIRDSGRLDCTDAKFVDIIHTETTFLGIKIAIGHLDFYPNGGYNQPGCPPVFFGQVDKCSHYRSTEYFVESINPPLFCTFTSATCRPFEWQFTGRCTGNILDPSSFATMGLDADQYIWNPSSSCGKREFFLKTRSSPTYCCSLLSC